MSHPAGVVDTSGGTASLEVPNRELIELSARFAHSFQRWLDGAAGQLPYPRLRVLELLHCQGPAMMKTLAEDIGLSAEPDHARRRPRARRTHPTSPPPHRPTGHPPRTHQRRVERRRVLPGATPRRDRPSLRLALTHRKDAADPRATNVGRRTRLRSHDPARSTVDELRRLGWLAGEGPRRGSPRAVAQLLEDLTGKNARRWALSGSFAATDLMSVTTPATAVISTDDAERLAKFAGSFPPAPARTSCSPS